MCGVGYLLTLAVPRFVSPAVFLIPAPQRQEDTGSTVTSSTGFRILQSSPSAFCFLPHSSRRPKTEVARNPAPKYIRTVYLPTCLLVYLSTYPAIKPKRPSPVPRASSTCREAWWHYSLINSPDTACIPSASVPQSSQRQA